MGYLQSSIAPPGSKFIVTDKIRRSKTITPDSTGFLSTMSNMDNYYQDVCASSAIITRRGKLGKNRLDFINLSIPIFFVEHENFLKILPISPEKEPAGVGELVHIEFVSPREKDITKMQDIDFMGWAIAVASNILSHLNLARSRFKQLAHDHPANILFNDFMRTGFNVIHDCTQPVDNSYHSYTDRAYRTLFAEQCACLRSGMALIEREQSIKRASLELHAATFLNFVNNKVFAIKKDKTPDQEVDADKVGQKLNKIGSEVPEYRFTENEKLLKDNMEYYDSKLRNLRLQVE